MPHIINFRVSKLAGRKVDVSRILDRHVNVFWGLNGSGKTTLLKILHAALMNDADAVKELPFESAEVVIQTDDPRIILIRTITKREPNRLELGDAPGSNVIGEDALEDWIEQINATLEWSSSAHGNDIEGEPPIDPEDIDFMESFDHTYLPITRITESRRRVYENADRRLNAPLTTDDLFVRQVRQRWIDYSAKSLSAIRDIQQQGLATVLAILFGGAQGSVAPDAVSTTPEAAFDIVRTFLRQQRIALAVGRGDFMNRYRASQDLQRVVEEIEDVRMEVEDVSRPQREFQIVIDEMYTGNKHLTLGPLAQTLARNSPPIRIMADDKFIPLKSLSSGEKQLLQILLEALAAENNTVMIDEPELSLHVDWQLQLVDSMRRVNPRCQLLLATHSSEVMADVADDSVFRL